MMFRPILPLRLVTGFVLLITSMIVVPSSMAQQQRSRSATIPETKVPDDVAEAVDFRSIGPANMMGRITAIAVYEKDPCIWWAASASGGLLKTTNNGVNFEHQFDKEGTVSIGDVQVAQTDPNIVWVGTGESNPRNSVSWGDGVYKSTDGGATWKNMGLKEIFQTGAIAIHPEDPNTVYVGALGRLWGANPERGLFKTIDGGETWNKVFYVNDETGVIDVQINPKSPDELLIATYERQRDGFDGNDPEKKYGAGSGIYKSIDGGASFEKISSGLPTCKLGRIGLDYFRADPNYVFAIVESEKIAKEPEDAPFAGVRSSDAEVGAKLTSITKDGPAEKAGLKENDIIVAVNGAIVHSNDDMLGELRKNRAGDTVKLVVSRDRKNIDLELTLAKKPEPPRRNGNRPPREVRTPFTGTLGGQAPNLQGQQGEDDHEYGGVYMSADGGSTWKRINSLNPRPMYYSHIRVDPQDRNRVYVCGTSLYKSEDGGKTFTGDGGSDGIHVDHHALWLDPSDPRHMILGNDGGIYVTYDRMKHWDHHNHAAIGQFYHVGVDANLNYRVYGGLQDNGSWGGPSQSAAGDGVINSDWFRVGGGDGFVTLVDPTDSDQIYFESQNGGMGRINLRTGERGFISPRAPRGTRYRFNWKSPFILSPHNPKVFYSAGNFVFRSYDKGDKIKAISPEITNTSKGSGSALSESPVEPGVVYVGTTDGAVWMTKNGGQEWTPLYYTPEPKKEGDEQAAEESESDTQGESSGSDEPAASDMAAEADQPSASDQPAEADKPAAKPETPPAESGAAKDPLTGKWEGRMISDQMPAGRGNFSFELKMGAAGKFTGQMESRRGGMSDFEGTFDAATGAISWVIESERGDREYTGTLKGEQITGEMSGGGGRFQVEFEANKIKDPSLSSNLTPPAVKAMPLSGVSPASLVSLLQLNVSTKDDAISGNWDGVIENEEIPGGRLEFTMELKMNAENSITGMIIAPQGDSDITEGKYDSEKKEFKMLAENQDATMNLEITGQVDGTSMSGSIDVNGEMQIDFKATKKAGVIVQEPETPAEPAAAAEAEKTSDEMAEPKAEAAQEPEQTKEEPKAEAEEPVKEETKPAADQAVAVDDPVSGDWEGSMESPRGSSEFSMSLQRGANNQVTGSYTTQRGEGELTEGKFDPETKKLSVVSDNGRFSLEWIGEIKEDTFVGEVEMNNGQFSMSFDAKRTGKPQSTGAEVAETKAAPAASEKKPAGKTLADLLPGPRWVSSIDASHFSASRCYISFDGHRSNDDLPYLFVTDDYGKSWKSVRGNLPDSAGSVRVLREDIKNPNLLYLGCEFGAWFSIDRGQNWTKFKDLPTVAVHEFAIHPIAGDIVVATHGRSLWIADVTLLRQMTSEALSKPVHLFATRDVIRWRRAAGRGDNGTREFKGEDPKSGTTIAYSLSQSAGDIALTIKNLNGDLIKQFTDASTSRGVHQFSWDLRKDPTGNQETGGGRGRFGGGGRGQSVPTGNYQVELRVDGQIFSKWFEIKPDPDQPRDAVAADEELEFWLELMEIDD